MLGDGGMDGQPEIVTTVLTWLDQAGEFAFGWPVSPADVMNSPDGPDRNPDRNSGRFGSVAPCAIWHALKAEASEMPDPHRVAEIKGVLPK